ncbi:MAG: thiol:disulfide interchange protein DsbA/DsbL [Gammaproteobacteria bacterium]
MNRPISVICAFLVLLVSAGAHAADWVEGKHYFPVTPAQHTTLPSSKVEVAEIFSYGCPYCSQIYPIVEKLKAALPANAQLVYVPASFLPREAWPMYQRAFYANQALGIGDKTHRAMFDAVWKTRELSYTDPSTNQIKSRLPTIEDAASFIAKTAGVKEDAFLAASKSFGVEMKMKNADAFVNGTQSLSTPTFVVNGKYRLNAESAGSYDNVIEVVKYLVAKETPGAKVADAAKR